MPETRVEELETEAEWDAALPILRQLWTDADEGFVRSWADEDDYRLFGLYLSDGDVSDEDNENETGDQSDEDEELVGVVGLSIQRVLHHARHVWIHDIVVRESRRSERFGAELLSFVESWARERDCEYVALANRLENEEALRFYEREGMEKWGYVVETEL